MPSYDGDSIIIMLDITLKHEQIDSEKKCRGTLLEKIDKKIFNLVLAFCIAHKQ